MFIVGAEISSQDVLNAFQRDAPYLFLGAAFVTVGVVSAALAALRRQHNSLLIYFALFAVVYGARLWIKSSLMQMTAGDAAFYSRLGPAVDFIVPLPAVLFFGAAGLLDRVGRIVGYVLAIASISLAVAAFGGGSVRALYFTNNIIVIAALSILVLRFATSGRADPDLIVIQRGLLFFVAFALWDNVRSALNLRFPTIEPLGFVGFLGALGYVTARRTMQRDNELTALQQELDVARRIQLSILPGEFPQSANFKVAARYVPMAAVAGDFYDYIAADDKRAGLLIADVSGHGVPAALIASMVKLAATSQRANAAKPSELLAGMNASLFGNTQNQFVTAAYVHLDAESAELRYSAAGHPAMLLLRDGAVHAIEENGLMLAAFDFATYLTAVHRLQRRDRILLYTDGIVEAANAQGEFFGQDALCAALQGTANTNVEAAADRILAIVLKWSAAQYDDLTVLVCDYTGGTTRS